MTILIIVAALLYLFNALWLHAFTRRGLRRPNGLTRPAFWYTVAWGWPVVVLGAGIAALYQTLVVHCFHAMPSWNDRNRYG